MICNLASGKNYRQGYRDKQPCLNSISLVFTNDIAAINTSGIGYLKGTVYFFINNQWTDVSNLGNRRKKLNWCQLFELDIRIMYLF